jgi:predicted enzyme related to lactoylglutathione lyase
MEEEVAAMPQNLIQHIEWTTRDATRLRAFYGRIFDWKFREAMPNYTLIEGLGGIFDAPDPQMPVLITPYVNVRDLTETEAKVRAAGGQIHKSRQEVPGMGWFTLFSDPDGNVIGLWQAMQQRPAKKPARKKVAKKTARKTTARKAAAKKPAKKKAVKKGTRRRR